MTRIRTVSHSSTDSLPRSVLGALVVGFGGTDGIKLKRSVGADCSGSLIVWTLIGGV